MAQTPDCPGECLLSDKRRLQMKTAPTYDAAICTVIEAWTAPNTAGMTGATVKHHRSSIAQGRDVIVAPNGTIAGTPASGRGGLAADPVECCDRLGRMAQQEPAIGVRIFPFLVGQPRGSWPALVVEHYMARLAPHPSTALTDPAHAKSHAMLKGALMANPKVMADSKSCAKPGPPPKTGSTTAACPKLCTTGSACGPHTSDAHLHTTAMLSTCVAINHTVPMYMDRETARRYHRAIAYSSPRTAALLRLVSHDIAQVFKPKAVKKRAALHASKRGSRKLGATYKTHRLLGAADSGTDDSKKKSGSSDDGSTTPPSSTDPSSSDPDSETCTVPNKNAWNLQHAAIAAGAGVVVGMLMAKKKGKSAD